MSKPHPKMLQCGSYRTGHQAHWIQATHAFRDQNNPPLAGMLLDVDDDGTISVRVGETIHRLWHHQPARLAELVARNEGAVTLQLRWSLLRTASPDGWYGFSVCEADSANRVPCPDPNAPPPSDLFELIEDRGGFDLAVDEAVALVARSATERTKLASADGGGAHIPEVPHA